MGLMQVTAMSFSEKRVKREIIVKASRPLSPLMRRITFGGDGLAELGATPPARWIKLFLPTGKGEEAGRAYTIRRYHVAAREMEVDFVIHGDGPASRWAERASLGEVIAFGGPRGGFAHHAEGLGSFSPATRPGCRRSSTSSSRCRRGSTAGPFSRSEASGSSKP
jgi:NADPH-dependent ferric siderophore reductase